MTDNKRVFADDEASVGGFLELRILKDFSEEYSRLSHTGSELRSSELADSSMPSIENSPFMEVSLPFMRNMPTPVTARSSNYGMDYSLNEVSSSRQNEGIRTGNELFSTRMRPFSELPMNVQLSRSRDENTHMGYDLLSVERYKDTHIDNKLLASGRHGDIRIGSEFLASERHDDIRIGSELLASGRHDDIRIGSELLASGRHDDIRIGSELLASGRHDDIRIGSELLASGRDEDIHIGNESLTSGGDQDIHFVREELLCGRVENIATQLLAITDENNPCVKIADSVGHLSVNDISIEYCRLYSETRPEDYDFAMNIMAYIEILNDGSWKATGSYFDENVKRMVKKIWNEKKGINTTIDFDGFNSGMILNLMDNFTKWSLNRKYDFVEFLNYCVIMCQLGVISRIRYDRKAPLLVIHLLRDRIKSMKFENLAQAIWEMTVKEYAKRLVE